MMWHSLIKERKSQIFIGVLIIFAIIMGLGAALLFHSRSARDISRLQSEAARAYSLARSGLDIGQRLGAGFPKEYVNIFGEGTKLTLTLEGTTLLTSTGTVGNSTRILHRTISASEPPSGAHWTLVDDPEPDDDATYVWTDSKLEEKDAYQLTDPVGASGTINQLRIFTRYKGKLKVYFRLNGMELGPPLETSSAGSWGDNTTQWYPNKPGGGNWTWTDVTDLQVAVGIKAYDNPGMPPWIPPFTQQGQITQVYVEVDYDGGTLILRPNGTGHYTNIENPPLP